MNKVIFEWNFFRHSVKLTSSFLGSLEPILKEWSKNAPLNTEEISYSTNCQKCINLLPKSTNIVPFHDLSFLHPFWRAVRFYRPNLEVREPIWDDDWSHSLLRRCPSWGFSGFSLAVKNMPGDLCRSPYHKLTDVTDVTLGASGLWLGTRTGADGTATLV